MAVPPCYWPHRSVTAHPSTDSENAPAKPGTPPDYGEYDDDLDRSVAGAHQPAGDVRRQATHAVGNGWAGFG